MCFFSKTSLRRILPVLVCAVLTGAAGNTPLAGAELAPDSSAPANKDYSYPPTGSSTGRAQARPVEYRAFLEFGIGQLFKSYRLKPRPGQFLDEEVDYFGSVFYSGYIGFEVHNYWSKPLLTGFQIIEVPGAQHPEGGTNIATRSVLFLKSTTRKDFGFFDIEYGIAGYTTLVAAKTRQRVQANGQKVPVVRGGGIRSDRSFPFPAVGARFWPGRMVSFSIDFLTGESRPIYGFLTGSFWLNFPQESYIIGWSNFSVENIMAAFSTRRLTSGLFFKYVRRFGAQSVWVRTSYLIDASGFYQRDAILNALDRFHFNFGYGLRF